MTKLMLGKRAIGPREPVLVIAEIGVNHDGSVARALELVELAAECGADAVKLQVFHAGALVHASCRLADYQQRAGAPRDPGTMLRKYELSTADLKRVVDRVRALKLLPVATPFSPADVETIAALNLPVVKIASPDLVNRLLLEATAAIGRPLLISTGAATMQEIDQCARWMRDWQTPFALLHCISSYPTPAAEAHLGWISELRQRFDVPVGYSDHTNITHAGALAVGAGARFVEKHLTYDRSAAGPDHAASGDAKSFARYVKLIRQTEEMLGQPGKCVLDRERDVRLVSRQSLVLCRALRAGEPIQRKDLSVQRPGTGVSPAMMEQIVGRKITRDLPAGALLKWDMISRGSAALGELRLSA